MNYDFEGLWFNIYKKVLQQNESLGDKRLDKAQLREVTTSIFIAQSQRGVVRPLKLNNFTESILKQISGVNNRDCQEKIYKNIKQIMKEMKHA